MCAVMKLRRDANLAGFLAAEREYRATNPSVGLESSRRYEASNKEKRLKKAQLYRGGNRVKACEASKAWQRAHPAAVNAANARRRATKLRATPLWADEGVIAAVYTMAHYAEALTGIKHHVDHAVPLDSRLVSGLHVEFNLEILPGVDNVRKGNRFWPDMP